VNIFCVSNIARSISSAGFMSPDSMHHWCGHSDYLTYQALMNKAKPRNTRAELDEAETNGIDICSHADDDVGQIGRGRNCR
jgi:predicted N-acyltransferase